MQKSKNVEASNAVAVAEILVPSPISVARQQYTDTVSVLRAIVTRDGEMTSLFALLMYYIKQMVSSQEITTPSDLANYIRHNTGCQFDSYLYKGETIVPSTGDLAAQSLTDKSKTLANLVSMLNRKTAELARCVNATTVKQLDELTKPVAKQLSVDAQISEATVKAVLSDTRKLVKENSKFYSDLTALLKQYGKTVEFQTTTKVVIKRK